jgi:1,2-diacylglycerol 3-alpha-glucosyltransferase
VRIALVTNNYTPYSGGVVSSINAYAQQLIAQGNTVLIVTLDFLGNAHYDEPNVKRVASITHFVYKKNPMGIPWRPDAAVLNYLQEFKPDIVHAHHPFLLGQSALYAARALSIPLVFTYHTLYEEYSHYIPLYQPWIKVLVTQKVLQFCSLVDHIIAPGHAVRDYLVAQGIKTPVTILPSPVQPEFFADFVNVARESHVPFRLVVVSRLVKEKNIEMVLTVMARLAAEKFHLTIVGYGEQEEVLRNYAYRILGLSEQSVHFVIRPSHDELIRVYHESDLFLFTSITDTQGIVLAESMASGVPVLALDGPGQRDIVRDGINGFIVHSADAMAQVIHDISNKPDTYVYLRQGAYKTAQSYRPELLARCLQSIYIALRQGM